MEGVLAVVFFAGCLVLISYLIDQYLKNKPARKTSKSSDGGGDTAYMWVALSDGGSHSDGGGHSSDCGGHGGDGGACH